jgi:hypothetical protein
MKTILVGLMLILFCRGCLGGASVSQVEFVYFNLSTNEIWVTGVIGLPADASPGRLRPVRSNTNRLEEASSTFLETIPVADQLKIEWKENGPRGWPGGVDPPGSVPSGVSHGLVLKREDLKIPARMKSGKVRFTYFGDDKWTVELLIGTN